jgi:predicted RND superfamily exporter protein
LGIGVVAAFSIFYLLFRSFRFALIGIAVNMLPVLSAVAVLGLMGTPIDMGSSVVAAIAFGIVLDDSTHLMVRIQRLLKSGYDAGTATMQATRELIGPIVTTTTLVCVGFLILFAAEIKTFHDFAIVMLIALSTALVSDLVVLPLLVRGLFGDRFARLIP